jgi:hypothetical protein
VRQGAGEVINVEDWPEIRRLHGADGMGIRAIARQIGLPRNAVREAIRSEAPPRYERQSKGSIVDASSRTSSSCSESSGDAGDGHRRAHRLAAFDQGAERPSSARCLFLPTRAGRLVPG